MTMVNGQILQKNVDLEKKCFNNYYYVQLLFNLLHSELVRGIIIMIPCTVLFKRLFTRIDEFTQLQIGVNVVGIISKGVKKRTFYFFYFLQTNFSDSDIQDLPNQGVAPFAHFDWLP